MKLWWPFKKPPTVPAEPAAPSAPVPKLPPLEFFRPDHRKTYLFEYGELKESLNYINALPKPIFPAYTIQKFTMWKDHEQENVPVAIDMGYTSPRLVVPKLRLRGEIYDLTQDDWNALDNFRQNGVYFRRKNVQIQLPLPNAENNPVELRAFIYTGNGKMFHDLIQWDQDFYRDEARFSPIKSNIDKGPWDFGEFYEFSITDLNTKACRNGSPKCYLYNHKHIPEPKVPAPPVPPVKLEIDVKQQAA